MKFLKKKIFRNIKVELIIAILIAACIIWNTYIFDSLDVYNHGRYDSSLFVPSAYIGVENEELQNLILQYHPSPTRMIEVYDDDFNLELRVIIDKQSLENHSHHDIKEFPELMKYLKDNTEGHTYYMNDKNTESDFYFTWYETQGTGNERQIVLIFISRPRAVDGTIHDVLSYIMLILTFSIIFITYMKDRKRNNKLLNDYNAIDDGINI